MWSLPDITRLNSHAHDNRVALQNAVETGYLNGERLTCECAGWGRTDCTEEMRHSLYYDIFSDDPKGILTLCSEHDGYFGNPTEGYFTCADCQRVMVENYTWERYSTIVDDEELCLPCAAKRYIADPDNWIRLTPEDIAVITFEVVRQAKHVIGVRMPVPQEIEFIDNAEFDSSSGTQISGSNIQNILTDAMNAGHKRALLILDAGYQFAVSIGVYVDAETNAEAA